MITAFTTAAERASRVRAQSFTLGEAWEDGTPAVRLALLVRHVTDPAEWFATVPYDYLGTLAAFRYAPPGRWGELKARFKDLGGNPWDLEKAVDAFLEIAPETPPEAKGLLIDMETVERKPVDWLWEPYLARGKLCMLDGDPGVGKTLLAIQLAANLSKEFPFPDQHGKLTLETGPPAPTLFVAMEDDLADTVKMRLEDAGADCTLIKVLNEVEEPDGRTHQVTLDDIPAIERILQDLRPLLVVIDSIQSVLGGRVDIHRANQVDEKLTQLARLAQRYHCAIVCIRHPSKPGQNLAKLMHRGLGSVAFIGKARLGLFVEEHPTDRSLVLLVQSKSNAGMPARTQLFSKREGLFSWAGVTRLTSQDLAGSGPGPDPTAMLGAYLWLEHRLDGNLAWPSADISAEGEEEGFSKKVLFVASKRLGIIKKQLTEGWTWRLPPLSILSPPTPTTTGVSGETGETGVSG